MFGTSAQSINMGSTASGIDCERSSRTWYCNPDPFAGVRGNK